MAALRRGSAVALAALVAAAMWAGMASAAVYEVGDKLGWTIMGSPDYGAWAASKKFSLGDTLAKKRDRLPDVCVRALERGALFFSEQKNRR
ncbi:unnamed protein product [Triticum turgidum subsp. durum]|uniref:Phytocyanin domain-containing protein n=1 Tax=Triticum turgidum subsp. durum TaxID=4567 RepID=A0A9R1NPM0_TRITD|nr:unnamed protein product [Triticum turgidum subsp. durum]